MHIACVGVETGGSRMAIQHFVGMYRRQPDGVCERELLCHQTLDDLTTITPMRYHVAYGDGSDDLPPSAQEVANLLNDLPWHKDGTHWTVPEE